MAMRNVASDMMVWSFSMPRRYVVRKEDARSCCGAMSAGLRGRTFAGMGISSYIEAGYGAAELRERIALLESERALAGLTGLDNDPAYMADLQAAIVAGAARYVRPRGN